VGILTNLIISGKELVKFEYKENRKMWRINPFLKILLLLVVFILGLFFTNPVYNLIILIFLLITCKVTQFPLREYIKRAKHAIIFIIVVVGFLQATNSPGLLGGGWALGAYYLFETFYPRPPWLLIWQPASFFPIYLESFIFGASRVLYLISVIIAALIVFKSTNMQDILRSMRKIGIPYTVAFTTATAFRFIPYIADYMITTLDAQQARGYDLGKGSLKERLNSIKSVLLQVFVSLSRTGERMAMVIQARGVDFNKSTHRTIFPTFDVTTRDRVYIALAIIAVIAGAIANFFYGFGSFVEFRIWLRYLQII
jgi:energy-coupling factor transport system permease protein